MGRSDGQAATRFLDALNSREPEEVQATLASDFLFEEAAGPGKPSIEALMSELSAVFAAFPDMSFRPVRHTDVDGRIYLEFRAVGTHLGEFLGVPATGTTAILSGVFNLDGAGGRVRRLRMTADFGGLRRQLLMAARMG